MKGKTKLVRKSRKNDKVEPAHLCRILCGREKRDTERQRNNEYAGRLEENELCHPESTKSAKARVSLSGTERIDKREEYRTYLS